MTGRPVKVMLPKDQELAHIRSSPKPSRNSKWARRKTGASLRCHHEIYVSVGDLEFGDTPTASSELPKPTGAVHVAGAQLEIDVVRVPHQCAAPGPSRSYIQQETKWSWENMMDEMAEVVGKDPVEFRLMHIQPSMQRSPAKDWHAATWPEVEVEKRAPYDSFPSVEVLRGGSQGLRVGQAESGARAARREDSSADSAWECRSITAA